MDKTASKVAIYAHEIRDKGGISLFGTKAALRAINKKLDKISRDMEKYKLVDYVYYLEHPRKMFFANFLGGLARGFGASVGFTLLAALTIYFLNRLVKWNLPLIGKFISEIVDIVQSNLEKAGGKTGA